MKHLIAVFCLALISMPINSSAHQAQLQSRAERTNYEETSRYADVMEFISGLQQRSANVKVESFAVTNEGRSLPLVILSNPAVNTPAEAVASGKPIVFVMANIHAGEVEGKEATQHLMRDVVEGSLSSLLDKIILLVAPIYNADGNEKIDITNRSSQNGPTGGVGVRENAQRMDLNRDYMKIESPEARGLIDGVFNRWDPHVIMDLHTTNGSYHGYALTYSPSLNPNADARIISFTRNSLLPDVTRTLKEKHNYNIYFYGNFVEEGRPSRETPPNQSGDPKGWATFDHRPRFGNNYEGLRNRIAILSEAYSYKDFRTRVDVTDKFVRAILNYIASNANKVVDLVREADRSSIKNGATAGNEEGFGITFELKPSPKPVEILVGSVTRTVDSRNNRPRLAATNEARPVKMIEHGEFRATRRIKPPAAYILKPDQKKLVDILLAHGIAVEKLNKEESFNVERYAVEEVTQAQRAFQGHREAKLKVKQDEASEKFPAGSFVVSMHQSKAALIFYLLEPESDDGLANWNYLDEELKGTASGNGPSVYPVYRLKQEVKTPRELVKR